MAERTEERNEEGETIKKQKDERMISAIAAQRNIEHHHHARRN
jgi:hypothetical protein